MTEPKNFFCNQFKYLPSCICPVTLTRQIEWDVTCKFAYADQMEVFVIISNVGIVNGEWSVDANGKCRYEWKELIDQEICDKGFVRNHSNYKGKCDKLCGI